MSGMPAVQVSSVTSTCLIDVTLSRDDPSLIEQFHHSHHTNHVPFQPANMKPLVNRCDQYIVHYLASDSTARQSIEPQR